MARTTKATKTIQPIQPVKPTSTTSKPTDKTEKPIERMSAQVCAAAVSKINSPIFDTKNANKHEAKLQLAHRLFSKGVSLFDVCTGTGLNIYTLLNEFYEPEVADELCQHPTEDVLRAIEITNQRRNSVRLTRGLHSDVI